MTGLGSSSSGNAPTSAGDDLFREWQAPWFPAIYAGVVSGAVVAVGVGVAVELGGAFSPRGPILIAGFAVFGVLVALVSTRRIRLTSEALRVGGKVVPLRAVTETGVVRGRELWRIRNRIVLPRSAKAPLLLGSVVPGVGDALAGSYLLATRRVRAGNCCAPGQGPAVLLVTPSLATPVWVVGSRHAEALKVAIDSARAALPQTNEGGDGERGWLPPARER